MKKFKISNIDIIKVDRAVEPHTMINPETGEQVEVTMQSDHDEYAERGFVMPEQMQQQQPPQQAGYMYGGEHNQMGGTVDNTIGYSAKKRKFKHGGEVDKYENLTGQYISELPPHLLHQADSEVEDDEYLRFPNGEIREAKGNTHENGGISLRLPNGTQILSDHLKVGTDLAKELKKEHGINVRATDTYANALEKYEKKLGLEKLNDEQAELFEMLDKEQKTVDKKTQRVNLEYLNSKILDIENKKKVLGEEKSSLFTKLFDKQEASKPNKDMEEFRYGGLSHSKIKSIADKHGISMEKAMFLLGGKKGYYEDGAEAINAVKGRPYDPNESFTEKGIDRLNMLRKNAGLEPISYDASKEEIRQAAGEMQKATIASNPELVTDYMLSYSHRPTNKLLGIMGISEKEAKTISPEELNKRLREAYDSGKITANQIAEGFQDNLWDYRGLQKDVVEVTPEELAKIQAEQRGLTSGDKTYYADPNTEGRYVEYVAKEATPAETPAETPTEQPDPTANIYETDKSGIVKQGARGFIFPDQSMLPPGALEPHLMARARRQRIDPVKMGVEDQLTEINRQAKAVEDQLSTIPPTQRAAALASILATTQQSGAKAITDVNRLNTQQQQSAELFNVNQADTERQLQNANLLNFEERQLTAKAKTDKDLRDYLEFNRNVALNNYRNQQTLNMIDVLSPDFSLDMFGNAIGYTPSYNFQLGDGSKSIQDITQEELDAMNAQEQARYKTALLMNSVYNNNNTGK